MALSLLAVSCGDDDAQSLGSQTTVPTVTTETQTIDDAQPPSTGDGGAPPSVGGDLSQVSVTLEIIAFADEPIDTVVAPNGEWWIAQRTGRVVVINPATGDTLETILDISAETQADGERGLLGMAIDEDALYINFTDLDGTTHVDAWLLTDHIRPGERHGLLTVEQPWPNHNGGGLAIGPDGHLYIGVGDGGSGDDPLSAGQDASVVLGTILRIEPTPGASSPYAIPPDNPYADGNEGQPEIFIIGARNPWRFSFDPLTDDLWIADVGQDLFEEIDLLLGTNGWGLGANLGWNLREGTHEFTGPRPLDNVDPVFEYAHDGTPGGCSVTGGHVYRGAAIPDLVGSYIFGDFCTSSLWALSIAEGLVKFRDFEMEVPGANLAGFGIDPSGELVTLSLSGQIARVVPA